MPRNNKNKKKKKSQSRSTRRQPNPPQQPAAPPPRGFDVKTEEGADAFIQAEPHFLETQIQLGAEIIRARIMMNTGAAGRVDPDDADALRKIYFKCGLAAENATKETFENCIADDQIELWLAHAAAVLKKLTTDPRWIRTGVLQKFDLELLHAVKSFAAHYSVVVHMANSKFLRIVSDFCKARSAPNMPCVEVAGAICNICNGFVHTFMHRGGGKWDDAFKRMEDQGLLAQAIRCFTVPLPKGSEEHYQPYLRFLDGLLAHCMEIHKKFGKGSKTGGVLTAIIEGRDGYTRGPRNPDIMSRLESLAKLCEYGNIKKNEAHRFSRFICWNCKKESLVEERLRCSNCKGTSIDFH